MIGIGGFIVARILETTSYGVKAGERQILETMISSRQTIGVVLAYIDRNNVLHIIIVTGDYPVELTALYINGSLASGCTVVSNGTSGPLEGFIVPYYSLAHIQCSLPVDAKLVEAVLYHGGGSVAVLAAKR